MTLTTQRQASRSKYHHQAEPQDWARVQTLYAFCRARAADRIAEADKQDQAVRSLDPFRDLRTLETMYAKAQQARHESNVVTSCAVTYFRLTARKDANHPDFLGEWV